MGRKKCSLKQQTIFRNDMLVTRAKHTDKSFGSLWCLFWLVLVRVWALPKAWGWSWLQGQACTALGAFRDFGLWHKPWLSQDLPGQAAWGSSRPEYLPTEHPDKKNRALLGQCLRLGRVCSNLWHLMEMAGSGEVEFSDTSSENPLLSLPWRDNCKTKAWEVVGYLLIRRSYIRTKCYNSIACWFPVMWNVSFCGEWEKLLHIISL